MILKLIETNDTPKIGDLVRIYVFDFVHVSEPLLAIVLKVDKDKFFFTSEDKSVGLNKDWIKVVKPYGISDEGIKKGDWYYESEYNVILQADFKVVSPTCKKVVIQPHQFNHQEIVDLWLKDGDELPFKSYRRYDNNDEPNSTYTIISPLFDNGKVMLSKPTPVTYTEEEVYTLLNKLNQEIMEAEDSRYMENDSVTQWFNLNKKKQ